MIQRWIAYLEGALVCVGAILRAYHAATQATRRKEMAGREIAFEASVAVGTAAKIEAAHRAAVHEKVAKEASGRVSSLMKTIAQREPELAEAISALDTRPKLKRKGRARKS